MDHPCETSVKCPEMSTKCLLSSFGPWPWALSLTVVTQDRKCDVLHGVIVHQSQPRLGHCCICTASCKTCPPLVQVVPDTVILIICNSNHGLQQFKAISIAISTTCHFGPGYRVWHCNELLPLLLVWLATRSSCNSNSHNMQLKSRV